VVGGNAKKLDSLVQYIANLEILGKTEQIKSLEQQKDAEYRLLTIASLMTT
jgi:hypothetical protein